MNDVPSLVLENILSYAGVADYSTIPLVSHSFKTAFCISAIKNLIRRSSVEEIERVENHRFRFALKDVYDILKPRLDPSRVSYGGIRKSLGHSNLGQLEKDAVRQSMILEEELTEKSHTDHNESLIVASILGRIDDVKSLVTRSGLLIPSTFNEAFRMAARHGHMRVIKLLYSYIDSEEAINIAFHAALSQGYQDIASILLEDTRTLPSIQSLVISCDNGLTNVVSQMIKRPRIDVNGPLFRLSPLILAIRGGYLDIVKLLVDHPDIQIDISYMLVVASHQPNLQLLQFLLEDPRFNTAIEREYYLFCFSVRNGDVVLLNSVLKTYRPNKDISLDAHYLATIHDKVNVTRTLLENGIHDENHFALDLSIQRCSAQVSFVLLDSLPPGAFIRPYLVQSIKSGCKEVTDYILWNFDLGEDDLRAARRATMEVSNIELNKFLRKF